MTKRSSDFLFLCKECGEKVRYIDSSNFVNLGT
jgi:transcription initiation factor IIE alpha subunit